MSAALRDSLPDKKTAEVDLQVGSAQSLVLAQAPRESIRDTADEGMRLSLDHPETNSASGRESGPTDALARVIGQRLSERLGQSFVIENETGGGRNTAVEIVAHASANGYTLLTIDVTNAINATVYGISTSISFAT
jgi:hypothetical protein